MTTAFVFTWSTITTPEDMVNRIKELNPDKIIVDSTEETAIESIYGSVFDLLEPWLEENNKTVNVLTPHLDNVRIRPRVIGELTYGMTLICMELMIKNRPDQLPPNEYYTVNAVAPYYGNLNNRHFDILYTNYNNNPHFHRLQLIDVLARENLLSKGIVTFHKPVIEYPWKYHDGSKLFDEPDFELHSTLAFNPIEYPQNFHKGFFDITSESRFDNLQFTEKTLKPILIFKPFIVNAARGFHSDYLFDYMGLKPYTELFDYSFDSCESMEDRVEGIVENVKRLSKLTVSERQQLYKDIIPKLIYNKSRLVELTYDKDRIVPNSLKFLMDGENHTVNGNCYCIEYMRRMGWFKENVEWLTT